MESMSRARAAFFSSLMVFSVLPKLILLRLQVRLALLKLLFFGGELGLQSGDGLLPVFVSR